MNFVLRVIGIFIAVAVAVWLVPGIEVGGTVSTWARVLIIATFGSGFVASIVISIVSSIMNGLLGADSYR